MYLRTGLRIGIATYQHRGGAVAEEARRDDVGDREIFALQRQRAQLDRQQHRHFVWIRTNVVGGASSPGGARYASQPEDWSALDFLTHPERADDASVDARNGNAGDGDEKQMIDFASLHAGALERDFSRRGADLGRNARPRLVGLGEGVERDVLLDGQGEMTPGDSERALDFVEAAQI